MELGNLGNVLGAIIGFVTVMLLLSILVTGFAQMLARFLDLRWHVGRNLVRTCLQHELPLPAETAEQVANRLYGLSNELRPGSFERVLAILRWHESIELDWMKFEKEVLSTRLVTHPPDAPPPTPSAPAAEPDLQKVFMRVVARISDRYAYRMRQVSVACSFLVAFAFQVSAMRLISDLSTSDTLRARSLELASQSLQDGSRIERTGESFRQRAENAINELQKSHPEAAAAVEEMSAISDTPEEVLTELQLVLKGRPDRDALVEAYRQILGRRERELRVDQAQLASFAQDGLATLNLRMAEDLCFYLKSGACKRPGESGLLRFGNIFGVLATTIFLTFGAPFWYETLKKIDVFQNALRKAVRIDDPAPAKSENEDRKLGKDFT
jgi:hypothetical protein